MKATKHFGQGAITASWLEVVDFVVFLCGPFVLFALRKKNPQRFNP
jgi:hypothetical protein